MPLNEIAVHVPQPGTPLLIAVSGGCDSMVLLDYLRRSAEWPLLVFHLDHQLRADSNQDAALVGDYCEQHGIPHSIQSCAIAEVASANGMGIEEAAREERYKRLAAYAEEQGVEYILTAHHQDDQIETILMNKARGAGLSGLCGMRTQRPLGRFQLLRPCLGQTRTALRKYAEQQHVPFREDSSNLDTVYARNAVRHELIPDLEHKDPDFRSKILAESAAAQKCIDAWDAQINPQWQQIVDHAEITTLQLQNWDTELRRYFWRRLLMHLQLPISRLHIQRCEDLLAGANSRRLQLGNMQLIKNPDAVAWIRDEDNHFNPTAFEGHVQVGDCVFDKSESTIEDPSTLGPQQAAINPQAIKGELVLRRIEAGEQWQALGAPGHKTVMSYLSDKKCPVQSREQMVVVADDLGILWIPGYTIAERARIEAGANAMMLSCDSNGFMGR